MLKTIGDLSRLTSRRFASKPAFVLGGDELTFAEVNGRSNRLAQGLGVRGVTKGDRVALVAGTVVDYAVFSQGIAKAGAIIVPVNPRMTAAEMHHVFADSGARLAFVQDELLDVVVEAVQGLSSRPLIAVIGSGLAKGADLTTDDLATGDPGITPELGIVPTDPVTIMYTSGTTGKPKGVLLAHAGHFQLIEAQIVELEMSARDVVHIASPLFTNGGLTGGINCSLWLGATSVFHGGSFDPARILPMIERNRVTTGFWVPTMLSILCQHEAIGRHDLSSVEKIFYGSMPTDPALLALAKRTFPRARFYQIYGSTECGFLGSLHPSVGAPFDTCTGREAFNCETGILDADDRDVAVGEVGEIAVRQSDAGMIGYWNNPEETRQAIRNGWIRSGDLVRREPEGFFTVVGRSRDLIISGAENIYPKEIELVIAGHPSVLDVAVFGIPDEKYGEAVCAAIELKPGATLTANEVDALCLEKLARYKRPRLVEFHAELPRNAMGKVTKQALRQPHWQGKGRSI